MARAKKDSIEKLINRSGNMSDLARKISIESKRLAVEGGLYAYGVRNGGYNPVKLSLSDNADTVYDKLIALAEQEVNDHFSEVGVKNGINVNLDSKQQDNPIMELLRKHVIKLHMASRGGYLASPGVHGVDLRGKDTEEAVDEMTRIFLGAAAGEALEGDVNWLRESPALLACVKFLQNGHMRQAIAKIGDIAEYLNFLAENKAEDAFGNELKNFQQTGTARDLVKYTTTDKKGRTVEKSISLTGTVDGLFDISLSGGKSKTVGISVKLAVDPFRIRYKTVSGKGFTALGEIIAQWGNNVRLSAYISEAYSSAPGANDFNLMLAATVASLAVGGYDKTNRALLAVTMSGYGPKANTNNKGKPKGDVSIKSLDKVLAGMKKDSKLRMEEVKISVPEAIRKQYNKDKNIDRAQVAYDENIRDAFGRVAGYIGDPGLYENAYQTWNDHTKNNIQLAFQLKTKSNQY